MAALLLFLVIYGFIVYPLAKQDDDSSPLITLSFSLVLVLGVLATTRHKAARVGRLVLAGLAFTSRWLHFFLRQDTLHTLAITASVMFFAMLAWLILVRVFRTGGITIYRIYGAIAAYLILGMCWAETYMLIYFYDASAFTPLPSNLSERSNIFELIYFSYVTLTTVGYGDIAPVHPLARSLATLEALVGQLYPAVLLGRLLTLYKE